MKSLALNLAIAALLLGGQASAFELNTERYDSTCDVQVTQAGERIHVTWPLREGRARMVFAPAGDTPLIESIGVAESDEDFRVIATSLDPILHLRVGDRDLAKRGGWTIFFDRMQSKPHQLHPASLKPRDARAESLSANRATLTFAGLTAGPFSGAMRWTFFAGDSFVLQEAIVATERPRTAFLYDMGLACRSKTPERISWRTASGSAISKDADNFSEPQNLAVRGRAVGAEYEYGSLAVFPPPHRYFYPLDFSNNFRNIWVGPKYEKQPLPFGFGIRHDARGDNRFAPWFNAPPGSQQHLGMFVLLSSGSAKDALTESAKLTREDRFEPLAGHKVFTSHYHVEHTREVLDAQQASRDASSKLEELPDGGQYALPPRLQDPGFVRVFREMGIDIAHLAEFHFGRTPRMNERERIRRLQILHAECRRLSDEHFLLLPGEEPNVHLGGHWISFFPRPVYWVLNRPDGTPFVREHPKLGRVYHVGSEADVLRLLREERGLAWTAHPRIKSSTGFPDRYRDRPFFQSEQFLGAAWKAMPADLSEPQLGKRVLDLLDDMSNWGRPKYVPGEVDVFKIEPDHELFGHMNVNYLRLDQTPQFADGWQPILNALREGAFFVTTGEVLIPQFTVNGHASGQSLTVAEDQPARVELSLKWTFPLSHAVVITGDGQNVQRRRIDLAHTKSFGERSFVFPADVAKQRWLRVEVWDAATNGAFTQPVWLR